MSLSKDTLCELFTERDGKLYNKYTRGKRGIEGEQAGCLTPSGYIVTSINSKLYRVHRLIYVMYHGHIPNRLHIDHINGDKADNRIENLRVLTPSQNQQNTKQTKGYHYIESRDKYIAYINKDGSRIHLGYHNTEEQAREAYLEAKKIHHIGDDYRQPKERV